MFRQRQDDDETRVSEHRSEVRGALFINRQRSTADGKSLMNGDKTHQTMLAAAVVALLGWQPAGAKENTITLEVTSAGSYLRPIYEETGLIPGNRLAESRLRGFYDENPLHEANLAQLPFVTSWEAFPGVNGLRISDVLREHMRSVVTLQLSPEEALQEMKRDVEALLAHWTCPQRAQLPP